MTVSDDHKRRMLKHLTEVDRVLRAAYPDTYGKTGRLYKCQLKPPKALQERSAPSVVTPTARTRRSARKPR